MHSRRSAARRRAGALTRRARRAGILARLSYTDAGPALAKVVDGGFHIGMRARLCCTLHKVSPPTHTHSSPYHSPYCTSRAVPPPPPPTLLPTTHPTVLSPPHSSPYHSPYCTLPPPTLLPTTHPTVLLHAAQGLCCSPCVVPSLASASPCFPRPVDLRFLGGQDAHDPPPLLLPLPVALPYSPSALSRRPRRARPTRYTRSTTWCSTAGRRPSSRASSASATTATCPTRAAPRHPAPPQNPHSVLGPRRFL